MKEDSMTLFSYIQSPGCYFCVVNTVCTSYWCPQKRRKRVKEDVVNEIIETKKTSEREIRDSIWYLVRNRKYLNIASLLISKVTSREERDKVMEVICSVSTPYDLKYILERNSLDGDDTKTLLRYLISYASSNHLEGAIQSLNKKVSEIDPENSMLLRAIKEGSVTKVRVLLKNGVDLNSNSDEILNSILQKSSHFMLLLNEILNTDINLGKFGNLLFFKFLSDPQTLYGELNIKEKIINLFAKKGVDLDCDGGEPLLRAAKNEDCLCLVKGLLKAGARKVSLALNYVTEQIEKEKGLRKRELEEVRKLLSEVESENNSNKEVTNEAVA